MQLWLSKSSEVPIREQITTQIMMAIVSNDLTPGQKLPSTRELARRFRIHANTVSAAYRDLARRKWVEFRKGSGVYVRELAGETEFNKRLQLDQIISTFIKIARQQGFSLAEIKSSVQEWMAIQPPDHFLLIERDPEFRRVLVAEITEFTGFPAIGAGLEACSDPKMLENSAPIAMYGLAEDVRAKLPPDYNCMFLRAQSVHQTLPVKDIRAADSVVTVVSHWPEFLRWAHTTLVAAGVDSLALNFRDAREPDWNRGLRACGFLLTDALTAKLIPSDCKAWVFRVLSDTSLAELRIFVEQFLPQKTGAEDVGLKTSG